jgi:TfoX/Sxy family transcriptional regulator of competence genes
MAQIPGFNEKKMFGGIGFLINGNMACGVHGNQMIVRLGVEQYEEAVTKSTVKTFDLTGKPMKGWITVAPEGYKSDDDLMSWINQGVAFTQTLPGK